MAKHRSSDQKRHRESRKAEKRALKEQRKADQHRAKG
jgi:hypothetical protein